MPSRLTTLGFWASGWRPGNGWAMAIGVLLQTSAMSFCMVYATVEHPKHAGEIMAGLAAVLGASVAFWAAVAAVNGISAWRRSSDKEADAKVAMAREG